MEGGLLKGGTVEDLCLFFKLFSESPLSSGALKRSHFPEHFSLRAVETDQSWDFLWKHQGYHGDLHSCTSDALTSSALEDTVQHLTAQTSTSVHLRSWSRRALNLTDLSVSLRSHSCLLLNKPDYERRQQLQTVQIKPLKTGKQLNTEVHNSDPTSLGEYKQTRTPVKHQKMKPDPSRFSS